MPALVSPTRYGADDMARLALDTGGPEVSLRLAQDGIIPRPVFLLSTVSAAGAANVAPYSYLCPVATVPPSLAVSFLRKADGSEKDTLLNLRATGEVVVNAVDAAIVEQANQCAENTPWGESEFALSGLTPLYMGSFRAPHVAESPLRLECRLESEITVGDGGPGSAVLVVLRVTAAYVAKAHHGGEGRIDAEAMRLIGRCGIDRYLVADGFFAIARPDTGEIPPR